MQFTAMLRARTFCFRQQQYEPPLALGSGPGRRRCIATEQHPSLLASASAATATFCCLHPRLGRVLAARPAAACIPPIAGVSVSSLLVTEDACDAGDASALPCTQDHLLLL
ncbi:hypothetical protein DPSP01_011593 [Paraphaeosphaeria sporulosa]